MEQADVARRRIAVTWLLGSLLGATLFAEEIEVRGWVVAADDGSPIVEASVWVDEDRPQRSDRRGTFRLPLARHGQGAYFKVVADGFLLHSVRLTEAELHAGEEVVVALDRARMLFGLVVDRDDQPIDAVELEAKRDHRSKPQRQVLGPGEVRRVESQAHVVETGTDGRFELGPLGWEDSYWLKVQRAGYAPRTVLVPGAIKETADDELVITLEVGLEIFGHVFDLDEKPIRGATVELISDAASQEHGPAWRPGRKTETDAVGRFEMADLVREPLVMVVSAVGFLTRIVPGLELEASPEAVDLGAVVLEPAASLYGKVTDAEGRPVGDARVGVFSTSTRFASSQRGDSTDEIQTSADGTFQFLDLALKSGLVLSVSHPDHQDRTLSGVEAAGPDRPVHVRLEPGLNLEVQVLDGGGRPVPGARVLLHWLAESRRGVHSALADEEGRFSFPGLTAGRGKLSARSPRGASQVVDVELSEEVPRRAVQLVLERGSTVRGRLVSPQGDPVAKGNLQIEPVRPGRIDPSLADYDPHARPESQLSDPEGLFVFQGLPARDYRITVEHPAYRPIEAFVRLAADEDQELELRFEEEQDRDALRLAGRVFDSTGRGIGGARLTAMSRRISLTVNSRQDGGFEIQATKPGPYNLRVEHPEYAGDNVGPIELGDAPVDDLVIQLLEGSLVEGQIYGLDLDRLAQLDITANRAGGGRVAGRVSHDGTYRIEKLGEGSWQVIAMLRSPPRVLQEPVTVTGSGQELTLDLNFDAGYRLSGVVLQNGLPLRQGRLFATCGQPHGFSASSALDDQGRFEIEGLPTESCLLRVMKGDWGGLGNAFYRTVEMTGDQDIVLEILTSTLFGAVRRAADLQPIAGARIELTALAPPGQGPMTASDDQGRFQFAEVQEGPWRLRVSADGFAVLEQELELEGSVSELELLLTPASPIVFFVQDADGKVPRRVNIQVLAQEGRVAAAYDVRPDPEGRAQVPAPPPGSYRLQVSDSRGASRTVELRVPGEPVLIVLDAR